ncbi:hypothetical protein BASA60_008509 [Batrachochytrium salamandrivorans]|nr:hypothetical protein BASA60_008509 [Batrachochytrium salamandrivorans]
MTEVSFVYCSSKQAFEDQMDYVSNQMAVKSKTTLVQYVHGYLGSFTKKKDHTSAGQIVSFTLDHTSTFHSEGNPLLSSSGCLRIMNNDLLTVFNKIHLLLDTQSTELNTKMELDKSHFWLIQHSVDFMKPIGKKDINTCIGQKWLDQYKKLVDMG